MKIFEKEKKEKKEKKKERKKRKKKRKGWIRDANYLRNHSGMFFFNTCNWNVGVHTRTSYIYMIGIGTTINRILRGRAHVKKIYYWGIIKRNKYLSQAKRDCEKVSHTTGVSIPCSRACGIP